MTKLSLSSLINLQNETTAVTTINNNSDAIELAVENTLSRDGTQPNSMNADLDMNSNRILNLPNPISLSEPLRLQDLASFQDTGTVVIGEISVSSIAALRLLAPGSFSTVNVLGYYASGDGGGGLFFWDSFSAGTDNGGTIITPSTHDEFGRWRRLTENVNQYTPKMFGAKADGTNDATYIQTAIDTISTVGNGLLYFDTTYTIGGAAQVGNAILGWKTGANIDGPGGLKLADNTNTVAAAFTASFSGTTMTVTATASGTIAAGQFLVGPGIVPGTKVVSTLGGGLFSINVSQTLGSISVKSTNRMVEMLTASGTLSNTFCKNITFDYNGANNCASQTIWTFNAVVSVQTGNDILFDGVTFKNNPGSNTIVLGSQVTSPTVSRARIFNCVFDNDGDRINTACIDYSTVFASCTGLSIIGCAFTHGPSVTGTAWEVYGSDIHISSNKVFGYLAASNVVAIAAQTTKNVNITGNTFQECSVGVALWALSTASKLHTINISNNTFYTSTSIAGPYLVDGITQVILNSELAQISITDNVFENTVLDGTRTASGISLNSVFDANISGNLLKGIPGIGIRVTNSVNPTSLTITGNTLLDVGYSSTSPKVGISVEASGTTGTLLIEGNNINPITGYTMTSGINNALTVSNGYILNNVINSATTPVVNTGTNVITSIPASVGSITGLGTGVATFLATPTSANLASAVTNETGTGNLVFSTSPALTTPTGIVKGDVGLGNVDNTSDVTKWAAVKTLTNTTYDTAGAGNSLSINGVAATANTGTGAVVRATSPTLVTPLLGTPTSGVATNLTGTAAGLTAGTVTTNANLTGDVTSSGNATTLTNAPVIAKVLTGYTSGAGTVSAADSILSAIQKLNGNDATNANLTGDVTSVGNATTLTNAPVIAKVLTGYTSGAGTVSAADSILSAIQKLNGNDATNANLTGAVTSVGNATTLGSFSSANLASALTDEDGTGLVPFETTGTWSPTDLSGATMTFTGINCKYTKIGNMIFAYGTFTFPSTVSASAALIGGLPFPVPNSSYASIPGPVKITTGTVSGIVTETTQGSSPGTFRFYNNAAGAPVTNTTLTLAVVEVNIAYPAT